MENISIIHSIFCQGNLFWDRRARNSSTDETCLKVQNDPWGRGNIQFINYLALIKKYSLLLLAFPFSLPFSISPCSPFLYVKSLERQRKRPKGEWKSEMRMKNENLIFPYNKSSEWDSMQGWQVWVGSFELGMFRVSERGCDATQTNELWSRLLCPQAPMRVEDVIVLATVLEEEN